MVIYIWMQRYKKFIVYSRLLIVFLYLCTQNKQFIMEIKHQLAKKLMDIKAIHPSIPTIAKLYRLLMCVRL